MSVLVWMSSFEGHMGRWAPRSPLAYELEENPG